MNVVREYLQDYGQEFKDLRIQAKLTQLKVAKCLGCSQAIISHIECGYMLPPEQLEMELHNLYYDLIK